MQLALGQYIDALDVRALTWLHQFIGQSQILDATLAWAVVNHVAKFGLMVFVICWLWFDRQPNQQQRREELVQAVLAAAGALLLGRVLSLVLPFRERPLFRPDLHLIYPIDAGLRTWSAFPSDHAVVAFALAVSLARLSPMVGLWAFAHGALVICLPRVYFGLHHPSDVIGGAMIGIATATAVAWLPAKRAGQGVFMGLERGQPALFYTVGFVFLYEIMTMFDGLRSVAGIVFAALRHVSH
jgi:membrane-associated phospholipid phosphatase